jgi:hypothetical protein
MRRNASASNGCEMPRDDRIHAVGGAAGDGWYAGYDSDR